MLVHCGQACAGFPSSAHSPGESQGRGFEHAHVKEANVNSDEKALFRRMCSAGDTEHDSQVRLSAWRQKFLQTACTIQYDSSIETARLMGCLEKSALKPSPNCSSNPNMTVGQSLTAANAKTYQLLAQSGRPMLFERLHLLSKNTILREPDTRHLRRVRSGFATSPVATLSFDRHIRTRLDMD